MPIELQCDQGTEMWVNARLGIPTASEFSRIVTPTGRLSAQREAYASELITEWVTGEPWNDFQSDWMKRGHEIEPLARACYSLEKNREVRQVGFVYRDERRMVGCSPDGMIDPDGVGEFKCPSKREHMYHLLSNELPLKHAPQCQGQIWVSGREYCEYMSFYPGLPSLHVTVLPDPMIQAAYDQHIPQFIEELEQLRERALRLGMTPKEYRGE